MNRPADDGVAQHGSPLRKWAIRAGIALLAFEIFYVVAANIFIRTDLLPRLINKKPEKTNISWDSATTYLPGVARVKGFTLLSQTKKDQVYLHVVEGKARISLLKLAFKTIHIRSADARDVDFRYRQRLDRPPKLGQEEETRKPPTDVEYWPEIPGWSNPPDPKPEDLYPMKKKKRPWTIKITGAHVEGPIQVALNGIRINGDGWAGGGVTVKPRRSITIHKAELELEPATVVIGPDVVTDDLDLRADIRINSFPAKGAKVPDIIGGISGTLSLAGRFSERAAVSHVITPGITTFGAGTVAADLKIKEGVLRAGSEYSLQSDAFSVRVMGLDATGTATVKGNTTKEEGAHATSMQLSFGDFQFVDPGDASVNIAGSGLELDAQWNGLSLASHVPATRVQLVVPPTQINDISAFNELIPAESLLSLQSGTGEVRAELEVTDRVAMGTLDLVAEQIVMNSRDTLLNGDLEVHAILTEGNLPTKQFDFSGTTIKVDNIVNEQLSEKKQEELEVWYCDVALQQGSVTFGKPTAADGTVGVKMYDTRPMVALLKEMGNAPKWLTMMPNVKDVDGTADMELRKGFMGLDNLALTGKGLEVLGTIAYPEQEDRRPALHQVQGPGGRGWHQPGEGQDLPLQTAQVVRGPARYGGQPGHVIRPGAARFRV